MTFFHTFLLAEKNNFSSNVQHNFAESKVISISVRENINDKPREN